MSDFFEQSEGCVERTLQIIGNKWTALIIRELTSGSRRFGQLQHALCSISPRTLSQRLDDLEASGIITKQAFAEVPPRVEYTLTAKGHDLVPVLQQMADWGAKHHSAGGETTSAPSQFNADYV